MREMRVAIAIEPVERTTSASEACWPASLVLSGVACFAFGAPFCGAPFIGAPFIGAPLGSPLGAPSDGTGAGGVGATIRLLAP